MDNDKLKQIKINRAEPKWVEIDCDRPRWTKIDKKKWLNIDKIVHKLV